MLLSIFYTYQFGFGIVKQKFRTTFRKIFYLASQSVKSTLFHLNFVL